jgi:hypothetical protein
MMPNYPTRLVYREIFSNFIADKGLMAFKASPSYSICTNAMPAPEAYLLTNSEW